MSTHVDTQLCAHADAHVETHVHTQFYTHDHAHAMYIFMDGSRLTLLNVSTHASTPRILSPFAGHQCQTTRFLYSQSRIRSPLARTAYAHILTRVSIRLTIHISVRMSTLPVLTHSHVCRRLPHVTGATASRAARAQHTRRRATLLRAIFPTARVQIVPI